MRRRRHGLRPRGLGAADNGGLHFEDGRAAENQGMGEGVG